RVIAFATVDAVVAGAGVDRVVTAERVDDVDAVPAVDRVVAARAVEGGGRLRPHRREVPDRAVVEHQAFDLPVAADEPVLHGDLLAARTDAENHVVADACRSEEG